MDAVAVQAVAADLEEEVAVALRAEDLAEAEAVHRDLELVRAELVLVRAREEELQERLVALQERLVRLVERVARLDRAPRPD